MGCNGGSVTPQFNAWFCEHKSRKIFYLKLDTWLDLRAPPFLSGVNHVIKQELRWKQNKL